MSDRSYGLTLSRIARFPGKLSRCGKSHSKTFAPFHLFILRVMVLGDHPVYYKQLEGGI